MQSAAACVPLRQYRLCRPLYQEGAGHSYGVLSAQTVALHGYNCECLRDSSRPNPAYEASSCRLHAGVYTVAGVLYTSLWGSPSPK